MKTLEQVLEDHDPLVIFPFGIKESMCRGVGDGFIFPDTFFWLDAGWNDPEGGAGTGSDHYIEGKIAGPFKRNPEAGIHSPYWTVTRNSGRGVACIVLLDPAHFPTVWPTNRYDLMYTIALRSRGFAEARKNDEYGSRTAALKIAKEMCDI